MFVFICARINRVFIPKIKVFNKYQKFYISNFSFFQPNLISLSRKLIRCRQIDALGMMTKKDIL